MVRDKTADIAWDRVFEKLYGHAPDQDAPPAYYGVLKKIALDFLDNLTGHSNEIIRQVALEAMKAGADEYLQYVFFVFVERTREWPAMPPSKTRALHALRAILVEAGDVPTYTDGLVVPPKELEQDVNQTLIGLAEWAAGPFRMTLDKELLQTIRRHEQELERTLPLGSPVISDMDALLWRAHFQYHLEQHPMAFNKAYLISQVIRGLNL